MEKTEYENMICVPSDAINIILYACRKYNIEAKAYTARTVKAQTMPEEERKISYMRIVASCKNKIGFDLNSLPEEKVHQILNTGLSTCISFYYDKNEFTEFCCKAVDSDELEYEYTEYLKQHSMSVS